MARKRLFEEIEELDKIQNPTSNVTIHGIVTSLSPIKKGRSSNYFDGSLSDGSAKIRLIGFNSSQQKTMKQLMENKEAVQLQDCEIKQARRGDKMEVMLKGSTQVLKSPKKFDVSNLDFKDDGPVSISLAHIDSYNIFDRVTVNVKILSCADPISVSGGKRKQDLKVADNSAACKVVLWEEHIGSLAENASCTLYNFVVREYAGVKFLSMAKDGSEIRPISDIGEVTQGDGEDDETMNNAVIVAVLQLDGYRSCLRCKARVEPTSPPLGQVLESGLCHASKIRCMSRAYLDKAVVLS